MCSRSTSSVAEYGCKFKAIYDQIDIIGYHVDDYCKSHWFLCGLGNPFHHFSISQRAINPRSSSKDLFSQAEGHELFIQIVNPTPISQALFISTQTHGGFFNGRGRGNSNGSKNWGGFSGCSGLGHRSPHCQLCRKDGHYANKCPNLQMFATHPFTHDVNIASAFQSLYVDSSPHWYVDLGATSHMTSSPSSL